MNKISFRKAINEAMAMKVTVSLKTVFLWFFMTILALEIDFRFMNLPGERAAGALFGVFMTLAMICIINYKNIENQIQDRSTII